MPANIDSMAWYGDPPWHGLGTPIPERADSETMIKAAGLDWLVEKTPIPSRHKQPREKTRKWQLIRKARNRSEFDIPLGMVSARYEPLQNSDAFRFFDPIVGEKAAIFETAGALGDGERIWVLAKLPDNIVVAGDDIVDKYLLLSNSHTGKQAITVKFTPIRVVCQNTLILALKEGEKPVTVWHTRNLYERLDKVPELLGIARSVFDNAATLFETLASIELDSKMLDTYLEAVIPRTEAQHREHRRPLSWEAINALFEQADANSSKIPKTLWRAYNSIIRFEDYRQAKEDGPDRRLNRTWFGTGADRKLRALQQAEALAQDWVQ